MGLLDWMALDMLLDKSRNENSGCGCISFVVIALGFLGIFAWKDMFNGQGAIAIIVVIVISTVLSILNKGININTVVACYIVYLIVFFIGCMIANAGVLNSILGAFMLAGPPVGVMFLLSLLFERFSD